MEMPYTEDLRAYPVMAVTARHLKRPWMPDCTSCSGVQYLRLSQTDRGFARFMTGKAVEYRTAKAKHVVNPDFMKRLRKKRRDACDTALRDFLNEQARLAGDKAPTKARRARDEDKYVVSQHVTIRMPEVEHHGDKLGPQEIQVLRSVTDKDIHMQVSVSNLEYLRLACAATPMPQRARKTRRSSGKKKVKSPKKEKNKPLEEGQAELANEVEEQAEAPLEEESGEVTPPLDEGGSSAEEQESATS